TSVELAERGRLIGVEVIRSPLVRSDPVSSRQNLPSLLELFRTWRAPIVHMHTGDVCLPRLVPMAMGLLRLPKAIVTVQSPYVTLRREEARARHWVRSARQHFSSVVCPSDHCRRAQMGLGIPE